FFALLPGLCRPLRLFSGRRLWGGLFLCFRTNFLRNKDREHLVAFHFRRDFHVSQFHQIPGKSLEYLCSQLPMRHLTTTESNGCPNLITVLKSLFCPLHPVCVIVIISSRSELDLLYGNRYLMFLC